MFNVTEDVQEFYTDAPFPNYNNFDDMGVFLRRANDGVVARLLRQQIPMNTRLLEVGCGTGQLSNYLAATTASHVYATDMTLASRPQLHYQTPYTRQARPRCFA